jgi:hypothetical protein
MAGDVAANRSLAMYIPIQQLPQAIQSMLRTLGYNKADIDIQGAESISPANDGSQGSRAYFAVINLATGERNVTHGSWGGANAFNPNNAVDLDQTPHAIPENVVAIKGCAGHLNMATLYVNPANLQKFLPEKTAVTADELTLLVMYSRLTSAGRKDEIARRGLKNVEATVASLVAKGLLKQNKAGATQITTAGKNAI